MAARTSSLLVPVPYTTFYQQLLSSYWRRQWQPCRNDGQRFISNKHRLYFRIICKHSIRSNSLARPPLKQPAESRLQLRSSTATPRARSYTLSVLQISLAMANTAMSKRNSPSLWYVSHNCEVCDKSSVNDDTMPDDVPPAVEILLDGKATSVRLKEAWLTVKNRIMSRNIGKHDDRSDEKIRNLQCSSARREFVVEVANSVVTRGSGAQKASLDRDEFRVIGKLHQGLTQKQCLATRDMSALVDPAWFK